MDQPQHQPPIKHLSPFIASFQQRHGNVKVGRLQLALLFFALRLIDAALLFRGYPIMSMNDKDLFLSYIIVMAIFSSVLLICVWFRQQWARYILISVHLLIVVIGAALLPCLKDLPNLSSITLDIIALLAAYFGVALTLIISKDIGRLTSRRFE